MPVYLGEYNTAPETEGNFEPMSTLFLGLLEEDGEGCIDHDISPERE